MSRIFGWRTAHPGSVAPHRSDRQARALALAPGARPEIVRRPGAEIGWVGVGPARTAGDATAAVVLDGRIYNRAELGFTGSDAEGFLELYRRVGFDDAMRAINADV